jgi:lysophospholipase L1-like esterase
MIQNTVIFALFFMILSGCTTAKIDFSKYQPASEKWEKEIQTLEAKDKTEKDPENAILFVGSSSIRLWKNIENDMKPYPVIQRGYGGSSFADIVFYIERLVKPHQFRALAMFAANDITGGDNDRKPEEAAAIVKEIIRKVRVIEPKKPIFIIEITPTNSRWKVWSEAQKFNALLKTMCTSKKNLYFIETAAAYLNTEGKPRGELFIKDQLHQNQEGYDIWARLIRKRLDEVLK